MCEYRFLNMFTMKPEQINRLRNILIPVECEDCGGLGFHTEHIEGATIELFGQTMEGAMIHARVCEDCAGHGMRPGFCAN